MPAQIGNLLAVAAVASAGVYLVLLGLLALAMPARTVRFLDRFASSAFAHLLELALRMLVGVSMLAVASQLRFPLAFDLFGGVLVLTTLALLFVPWRVHHRFARRATPYASNHPVAFGLASMMLGCFVLGALLLGPSRY